MASSASSFSFSMIYAGFKRVGTWWNFKDVISPFYRLYYIAAGRGTVYMCGHAYDLQPGQLFLIPKFTFHSYACSDYMDHYYVCFFDDAGEGCGIPAPENLRLQVEARPYDTDLVHRYLELNPNRSLVKVNPRQYDNDKHIYERGRDEGAESCSAAWQLESSGILMQLVSRFLTSGSLQRKTLGNAYERLDTVHNYISRHLEERITVPELAAQMCLTPDYFSKVFKKVFGLSPCEYVQHKRIERAQFLLLTSRMSVAQVAERVGIESPAQFTRLFTKITQCSPREYRAKQLSI